MREAVRDTFVAFTSPLEGVVPHFYADVKGLVTIAVGNLVDPVSTALDLPLLRADGTPAGRDEIAAEWHRVKADPRCATMGHRYAARLCKLRLDEEGLAKVVGKRLGLNELYLARRFPNWPEFPADAQLATLSMAWACGPAFRFPRLERALRVLDFKSASVECQMTTAGNPGLIPRNRHNATLYRNAAVVDRDGLDPDVLWWPHELDGEPPAAA